MTERRWLGVAYVAVLVGGFACGRWTRPASKTTATTHEAAKLEQTAHVDEKRTADVVAVASDTGTEQVDRVETHSPDGSVEIATGVHRAFLLKKYEHEHEQTEAKAEVRTVVQVVHDTKTVTEVHERQADWSLAVLGGIDAGITPLVAAQVGRRVLGPFEVVVQAQAAPTHLSRWAVFVGLGGRF